jgi:D-alanyl-lipoteichoic acid acyltransferase DltB (MBOAT superfamily)
MLFNSYSFLFAFLPIALLGYQIAGHYHRRAVVAWLGFASLAFYAYWRPAFLILLLASITFNYLAAALISRQIPNAISNKAWLWIAISVNLLALCYFKYLFPFLRFATTAIGSNHVWHDVVLPLGISFFTFTQIAYLVDLQQGIATQQDPFSYILFVSFFPHLIAGPILHHKEMMPQFQQNRRYRLSLEDISVGFSWFIMGLGKKVLLADHFAGNANFAFAATEPLSALQAWRGVLYYALQLYFDFSGYSDMALGLARMFSIDFPLNFSSPYKASNIIDFWQRWHITLTQYITSYVYSPLQFWISRKRQEAGRKVSRKAQATPEGFVQMIAFPMMTTMFIAGLWHGAGFQFILYGLLHGAYLSINHAWNLFRHNRSKVNTAPPSYFVGKLAHAGSVLLTFVAVVIAQIFFRANSTMDAFHMVASMIGLHGAHGAALPGEDPAKWLSHTVQLAVGFLIVWFLPNTQQILAHFKPSLHLTPWDERSVPKRLLWTPSLTWAAGLSCLFILSLIFLQDPSTFLYFQF